MSVEAYWNNLDSSPASLRRCTAAGRQYCVQVKCDAGLDLVVGVEDDDGDLAVAQHAQLVRFLHQPELPLGECYLSVPLIRNSCNRNFLSAHLVACVDPQTIWLL